MKHCIYSLLSILVSCNVAVFASTDLCKGKKNRLSCLHENYQQLLTSDEKVFYEILKLAGKKASICTNKDDSLAYLETAKYINGGASVEEFFSKTVEIWSLEKPKCVLGLIPKLSSKSSQIIIGYLQSPLFIEKRQLDKAFSKYLRDKDYGSIAATILNQIKTDVVPAVHR